MKRTETTLPGVCILEPKVFADDRGWFAETWTRKKFEDIGIVADFVQDNAAYSKRAGVIRGLHFQLEPSAQAKLIRVTRGRILDVAVDIRADSPHYLKWVGVELSAENMRQLFIPVGFAHGYLTLTDDVDIMYKCDDYYDPVNERCIRFDDPDIGVDWGADDPMLSEKDRNAPRLKDMSGIFFAYKDMDKV